MMEINPAKLQEEINEFKRGVYKKNSNIFNEKTSIKALKVHAPNENMGLENIHPAVRLAYLDAKRTMSNIGTKYSAERDKALKDIETELHNYFFDAEEKIKPAPATEKKFDEVHDHLCKIWRKTFIGKDKEIGTYGKAQKIVNMSFKYLRCCKDADNFIAHFKFCHMPLDSFTLEWFKREVKKWYQDEKDKSFVAGNVASWSALEDDESDASGYYTNAKDSKKYYSYRFYLKNIREYIKVENIRHAEEPKELLSPLELEFIEWPKTQKALAAEGFLFGLKEDLDNKQKERIIKMDLKDKYEEIVDYLVENGYYPKATSDETKEEAEKA